MTTFPLNVYELLGQYGAYIVFLIIGFSFGYVLEIAGFGNSPKLAAQFYFKEMTVLKVMFTSIIVAMVGVFLASALGILDYNLVWVNPTYLWPGIVGGLIMGVGFIVGGFCPGTSLVAFATAKIDGLFFVFGVLFGIFMFGESVENFSDFFYSSYMGRFTLMDWLGIKTGWVVLIVLLSALSMFWGGEKLEEKFGGVNSKKAPKMRYVGAFGIVLLALTTITLGQPSNADKWNMISAEMEPLLVEDRAYQIHPGELLDLVHNDKIKLFILDVRNEADYNLFHIENAQHAPIEILTEMTPDFLLEPVNAVFVLVSNDEGLATDAWKMIKAENVHNAYILEGGINYWLDTFTTSSTEAVTLDLNNQIDGLLLHEFDAALGANHPAATPDPHAFELEYTPKVKLDIKKAPTGGGCG
ncbi:MAG: YeeE/YedE thiosulfate transporter family protein [Chloroflexota bacterium]